MTWLIQTADVKTFMQPDLLRGDFQLAADGSLEVEDGLQTAVFLSLFTDQRAAADDVLPANNSSRRGWWGDNLEIADQFGSRLWLYITRGKLTELNIKQAVEAARAGLQWLIDDQVATSLEVTGEPLLLSAGTWALALDVKIYRGDETALADRYVYVWEGV